MSDSYITHFSQPDSIVPDPFSPQNLNRYSYVNNNPVNATDPSGNCPSWYWDTSSFCGVGPDLRGLEIVENLKMDMQKDIVVASAIAVQSQWGDPHPHGVFGQYPDMGAHHGYGIGQISDAEVEDLGYEPGDQMKPEVAIEAMNKRIGSLEKMCTSACTGIDRLIIAALAQNAGLARTDLAWILNHPKENGSFDWANYLDVTAGKGNLLAQFRADGFSRYDGRFMLDLYMNDLIALYNKGWSLPYGLTYDDILYVKKCYVNETSCARLNPSSHTITTYPSGGAIIQ